MGDRTTLTELYLQIAKARAFEVIGELIEGEDGLRFGYGSMREFLEALSFPSRAIPSEEEYLALFDGKVTRTPFPLTLSDNTRRRLAAGLRALADDLVRPVPGARRDDEPSIRERIRAAIEAYDGEGGERIYVSRYGFVYVPMRRR